MKIKQGKLARVIDTKAIIKVKETDGVMAVYDKGVIELYKLERVWLLRCTVEGESRDHAFTSKREMRAFRDGWLLGKQGSDAACSAKVIK